MWVIQLSPGYLAGLMSELCLEKKRGCHPSFLPSYHIHLSNHSWLLPHASDTKGDTSSDEDQHKRSCTNEGCGKQF